MNHVEQNDINSNVSCNHNTNEKNKDKDIGFGLSPSDKMDASLPPKFKPDSEVASESNTCARNLSRHQSENGNSSGGEVVKTKMKGYMDKRSKLLGWRKYWFVLDGRLLTYYKSEAHYQRLAVCCGSINLGIATRASPIGPSHSKRNSVYNSNATKGFTFQIVTKTQLYYLRCREKNELDDWLIAIQHTVSVPPSLLSTSYSSTFALDSLDENLTSNSNYDRKNNRFSEYSLYSVGSKSKPKALSQWSLNNDYEYDWMDDPSYKHLTASHNHLNSKQSSSHSPSPLPKQTSLLKKYHSLTSLAFPFSSPFTPKSKAGKNLTTEGGQPSNDTKRKSNSQSTQNLYSSVQTSHQIEQMRQMKEKWEVTPKSKITTKANLNNNGSNMRQASSLLILNETPRRFDLLRKTSTPPMSTSTLPSHHRHRSSNNITDNNFNVSKPPVDDLNHGIYEPCGEDYNDGQKTSEQVRDSKTGANNGRVHLEWEGAITNTNVKAKSPKTIDQKPTGDSIYESLDDQNDYYDHPNPNAEDIEVFLTDQNNSSASNKHPTATALHHRYSLHPRDSIGGSSLVSIDEETPQSPSVFHSCDSDLDDSNVSDMANEANNSTIEAVAKWKKFKKNKPPKSPKNSNKFAGFLQTMFSKSKKKQMDISGPVDLRSILVSTPTPLRRPSQGQSLPQTQNQSQNESQSQTQQQDKQEQSRQLQLTRSTSQLKQKHPSISEEEEGEPKQIKKDSSMGFRPAVGSDSNSTENLLLELNKRIGQRHMLKKSNSDEHDHPQGQNQNQAQKNPRMLCRKTVSHSEAFQFQFNNNNKNSVTESDASSTTEVEKLPDAPAKEPEPACPARNRETFYSRKISPAHSQSFHAFSSSPWVRENSKVRSSSYSCPTTTLASQKPPSLPPKKKPCPTVPLYDVPQNNSPVPIEQLLKFDSTTITKQPLAKSISSPVPTSKVELELTNRQLSASLLSSTDSQDTVRSQNPSNPTLIPSQVCAGSEKPTPPKPPPRPAKKNTTKSQDVTTTSNESLTLDLETKSNSDSEDRIHPESADDVFVVQAVNTNNLVTANTIGTPSDTPCLTATAPRASQEDVDDDLIDDGVKDEGKPEMRRKPGTGLNRPHRIQSQTFDEETVGRVISSAEPVVDEMCQKPEERQKLKLVQSLSQEPLFAQPLKIPDMEKVGPVITKVIKKDRSYVVPLPSPKKGKSQTKGASNHVYSKTNSHTEEKDRNKNSSDVSKSNEPENDFQTSPNLSLGPGSGSGSTSGDSGVCGDAETDGGTIDLVGITTDEEEDDGSHFYDDVPIERELVSNVVQHRDEVYV